IQSEKLVEVGRLSASIAHEINNPLTVIAYAAQLLLREEPISGFQQELLERIEGESDRLKTLTGSLLSFSRARESVRRPTDLNEVLRDVLRLLRFEFNRRSIDLEESYGTLPVFSADSNQLKQVFINLLLNAAQVLPRGGRVAVRTVRLGSDEVMAVIADSGPGVPAELRDKIFEPFFSTRKEGEGTGLGLYICRTIVAEHGGGLELGSEPEWGGVFHVRLPARELLVP
ncbi:MAG: sensor histidine kinase, partial [Desulfuromonadales bacterium]|nr:sensor histidine kinase [Desulfuromonadales bacterium]